MHNEVAGFCRPNEVEMRDEMKPEYARTTITVPKKLKKQMKRAGAQTNWSAVACEAFEAKLEELGPIKEVTSIDDVVARMKSTTEAIDGSRDDAIAEGFEAGKYWAMNSALPDQLKRIEEFKTKIGEGHPGWDEVMSKPHGRNRLAACIVKGHPEPSVEFGDGLGGWQQGHRGPRGGRHRRGPGHGPRGGRRRGGPEGRHRPRRDAQPEVPNPSGGQPDAGRLQRWKQQSAHQARIVWRSLLNERPSHPVFFLGFANGALEVWDGVKDKLV